VPGTVKTRHFAPLLLGTLGCLVSLASGGCDEKPAPAASATVAPVPSTAPTIPSAEPVVQAAPAPTKPKKTLAECPKGKMPELGSPEIEAAIRLKAQKQKGDLSIADLKRIKSLNISQTPLTELDICLFTPMTELKELFIGRGQVMDISPIEKLTKLESLRLSLNPVSDLTPLSGMTKLDRLDLAHTQVKDLTPLANATSLTELLLDDTPVSDVTPLAKLEKLEVLVLKNTQVKDIKALRGLKALKTLDLRGAPVDDPSPVMRPGLRVQQ
jgi:internalin A